MLYHRVDCPHCGNEITVNNLRESRKCNWCRRPISVKLEKVGKKIRCEVEPLDFTDNEKQDHRTKSYSKWKEEDIYGRRRN